MTVIRFPAERRAADVRIGRPATSSVVILPIVRVERRTARGTRRPATAPTVNNNDASKSEGTS